MSRRRGAHWLGSSIAVGAVILAACSIYDPSLLAPAASDLGPDGGDAATEAAPDADPCPHALAPPPPVTEDGVAALDLVFVVDSFHLLQAATPLGLDLDRVCTCPGPEACKSVVSPPKAHCDDDAGRDNSGGMALATFGSVSDTFNETSINGRLSAGTASILLRVRGYNGGANDSSVTAIIYRTTGIEPTDDGGMPAPPKRDGTDRWLVDPASIVGGASAAGVDCDGNPACIALTFDTKAYVADHVLVMRLDLALPLGGGVEVDVTSAWVTARLTQRETSFVLEQGNIAGRWRADRVLALVANATSPAGKGPLCNDKATYDTIKQIVCGAADLPIDPTLDRTDVPCDALSLGLAFTASAAHLGNVAPATTDTSPCGAPWVDSCK